MGEDQTRRLGFWRTHVDCDSDLAIKAGRELFAEPKHKAGFAIVLPVPNATTPAAAPPDEAKRRADAVDVWHVDCGVFGKAAGDGTYPEAERYYTVDANLRGLTPQPVSAAPFTEYGTRKVTVREPTVAKPLAAPLNVFSPYTWYDLSRTTGRVKVTLGKAPPTSRARARRSSSSSSGAGNPSAPGSTSRRRWRSRTARTGCTPTPSGADAPALPPP